MILCCAGLVQMAVLLSSDEWEWLGSGKLTAVESVAVLTFHSAFLTQVMDKVVWRSSPRLLSISQEPFPDLRRPAGSCLGAHGRTRARLSQKSSFVGQPYTFLGAISKRRSARSMLNGLFGVVCTGLTLIAPRWQTPC